MHLSLILRPYILTWAKTSILSESEKQILPLHPNNKLESFNNKQFCGLLQTR